MNGICVLIVHDNSRYVEAVRSFLLGLPTVGKVVHSHSPEQVVRNYTDFQCDLIVMNTTIEGLNGFDATRRLRANGCREPIFLLSTHAELEYHERAKSVGANALIWKYDFGDKIASRIEMIINKKRQLAS